MSQKSQENPIGMRLGEGARYEIRRRIGVGGMAEVYKAVDRRLGNRVVAIKMLSASVEHHPFAQKMRNLFIQEAQALSRVKDENVVDVLDFGTDAGGAPFMVMELLHGTDLGVFLKQNRHVAVDAAVDVILGVCAGVHACHLAGVIHRDLKPANIFLSRTPKGEQPKVLDFSVAKVPLSRPETEGELTNTDLIVGTPSYMSPEQAVGKPANELSDQYSIGALLYRCLVGRPPHGVLARLRDTRPDIGERLEEIIIRALDSAPEKRFATVHALGHALVDFASPAARGRWKIYYSAPPHPFDPASTRTIQVAADSGPRSMPGSERPSAAVTVTAPPYDFGAHDRSTAIEGATSTRPTAIDNIVASQLLSIAGAVMPPTIESPIAAPANRSALSGAPSVASGRSSSATSSARHGQRKVFLFFGAAAVLVVIATAAGIRLRGDRHAVPAPPPPEWTRVSVPAVVRRPPAPAPAPLEHPPAPTSPPSGTAVAPVPEKMSRVAPTETRRAKRQRHSGRAADAIEFGSDGTPILP